ncbi:MAG TPA: glycosyltransferase family 1 protein, partial [Pyrinomonadaceae bacterium]|nr:glycosyltransferase family 1 protein [Pyrinomonadaceae bacterium]
LTLVAELRRRPVDLLHVQYTAPPLLTPCPVVATIHDLSFEHLPETFNRRSRAQLRFTVRRTARSAAHVLTSSAYSAQQLMETYRLPPEKITVTPLAAAPHFAPVTDEAELQRVRETYNVKGDYLLAVGSIQPRKNLVRLIKAYADLCRLRHAARGARLPQLVLVGKQAWLSGETLRAAQDANLHGSRIVLTGYVPEGDLPALYSAATAFVYPSFFEGFGLPPLEAMRCGAPVITGNLTSLPEVIGEAGLMVNPYDIDELRDAMGRLIDDGELRRELSRRGRERAQKFDWARTAEMTLEVYRQVGRTKPAARAEFKTETQKEYIT